MLMTERVNKGLLVYVTVAIDSRENSKDVLQLFRTRDPLNMKQSLS